MTILPKTEFERHVEHYLPRLRRYAKMLTRDRVNAEDLVQTCLARAFAKQELWEAGTDLRAWLFTIMHHSHVNNVRRSIREHTYAELGRPWAALASPDPGARLELRDVGRVLANLPEHQHRVLMLVGVNGLDYAAAAAILGVPTGTVRSRLGRARETLRRELDRTLPPEGRALPSARAA